MNYSDLLDNASNPQMVRVILTHIIKDAKTDKEKIEILKDFEKSGYKVVWGFGKYGGGVYPKIYIFINDRAMALFTLKRKNASPDFVEAWAAFSHIWQIEFNPYVEENSSIEELNKQKSFVAAETATRDQNWYSRTGEMRIWDGFKESFEYKTSE